MNFDAEALRRQIPYYLTAPPAQKQLLTELKALSRGASKGHFFPENSDQFNEHSLQGDGWAGFQAFSFKDQALQNLRGIVLSNSCDIAPDNKRDTPPRISFAPLLRLAKLESRFQDRGLSQEGIESRLSAIRAQSVTSLFYLPKDGPLEHESVVLLDDMHSMPVDVFRTTGKKLFTLSMAGFYLFVFKLSVHLCRLQEDVDRSSPGSN